MLDSTYQKIVSRLPKKIVYFCAIRLMAHATCGKYGDTEVPKLDIITALKRWEDDYWPTPKPQNWERHK